LPGCGFADVVTGGFNLTVGALGGAGGFPVDFTGAGFVFAAAAGVDGLAGSAPLLARAGVAGCCFDAVAGCSLASAGADGCFAVGAGCDVAAAGAAVCFAALDAGSCFADAVGDGFGVAGADGCFAAGAGCDFAAAGAAVCFAAPGSSFVDAAGDGFEVAGAGCFGAEAGCCFAVPGVAGFAAGSCPANNGVAVVNSTTTVANTLRLITAST
jgi:hypothetical protein